MLRKLNDKFSPPGTIDAKDRYRVAARRLRNTVLRCALPTSHARSLDVCSGLILALITLADMTLP
jgi:hypothetical protein